MRYSLIALLALLTTGPAAAQEWQVAREAFAFAGSQLTIRVDAEAAGTLRVIRGAPGSVRVASRTDHGFGAAGLAEGDELTLTSAGPGAIDYLVSVPENVWVRVRLPGTSRGESMGSRSSSRTFEWGPAARPSHDPVEEWLPTAPEAGLEEGLYTTFAHHHTPAVVALPDLANVRSLTVRLEEGPFRAITSRPLSTRKGDEDRLEIRPAAPAMDIVLVVPRGTTRFRLDAGGEPALVLEGDSVTTLCSPMTQQWLSNGRRWLTFNPVEGALECTAHEAPRHEG